MISEPGAAGGLGAGNAYRADVDGDGLADFSAMGHTYVLSAPVIPKR